MCRSVLLDITAERLGGFVVCPGLSHIPSVSAKITVQRKRSTEA